MSLEARVSQVVARVGVKRIAVFKKHAKKISGTKKIWVFKKYSGSKKIGSKKNATLIAKKMCKRSCKKNCNTDCKKIKSKKICKCACIALVQAVLRVCGLQVVLRALQGNLRMCQIHPHNPHIPPLFPTICPSRINITIDHLLLSVLIPLRYYALLRTSVVVQVIPPIGTRS